MIEAVFAISSTRSARLRVVKDPVVSGYAHAAVVTRPWRVLVDGATLMDRRGRPRRFSTARAAWDAAQREARRQVRDEARRQMRGEGVK